MTSEPGLTVPGSGADVGAGARPETPTSTFTILFVCTGNLCRSPMAERLAARAIAERLGDAAGRFVVASAGTGTCDGLPMTPEAETVLREHAVEPGPFLSTELTPAQIASADLVLTATRAHRSQVVSQEPGALRRSFTLTEFARTAGAVAVALAEEPSDADPVVRARDVVAATARRRGTVRPGRPEDDDIPDPIGRPIDVYRAAAAQIADAVDAAFSALLGR